MTTGSPGAGAETVLLVAVCALADWVASTAPDPESLPGPLRRGPAA